MSVPGHGARIGQERIELVEGPGAALGLHGGRVVEAACDASAADHAVKIGADLWALALAEVVAGAALLGDLSPFSTRRWPAASRSARPAPGRPPLRPPLPA